tara:strand:- start:138 stop:551 length:414 start_codon:yes stop_codon:yes gene_type:complete
MSANIDQLIPTKSIIDLSTHSDNDFGLSDYDLCSLFDDLLLAEFADETIDGDIMRDGVIVPGNSVQRAWRVGKVLLAGCGCQNVKSGDYIIFPHDKGIPISGITVEGYGKLAHGIFLNEERLFGVVKPKDESSASNT